MRTALVAALVLAAAGAARAGDDHVPVWLGIRYGPAVDGTGRLQIGLVFDGTAAAQAGLAKDDLVLAIDGVQVMGSSDLRPIIYPHKVGDHLRLDVLRGGKHLVLDATLLPRADGEIVQRRLVDKPAPDFSISMPDDSVVDLASLEGKVAVLAFFPAKCDACAGVVSALGPWSEAHASRHLVVLGATPIGSVPGLKAFLARNPVLVPVGSLPVQTDPDAEPTWFADPSNDAVTFVVIDAKGIVRLASIVVPGSDDGVEDVCVAAERALKAIKRR